MEKPTLHLICNAHLDPVWQWRWEEGCAEAISTFRSAVEILHEHKELVFNHNEALLYRWVRDYEPRLFLEIQELVRRGRWSISGGWYLQPDVNLPGTESLFRHIAEGLRFFGEHFHVRPTVAYNLDSFGHSGGLPQILTQCGYRMYIHMRPQPHELSLPSDLYRWRGVDGTEIPAYRIAVGLYHTERDNVKQRLAEGVGLALKLHRDVPVFWGLGDHGGGATREDLRAIEAFAAQEKRVKIVHSTPEMLAEALRDAICQAPVVEGDLQRAFTGCYTSLSRVKRRAQEGLLQLTQTEALRAATWWIYGQEYPEHELDDAWRDHLFNDFHDILPGSCTQPAEQDALDQYGRVSESARRLRMGAAVQFTAGPLRATHVPVTVLCTHTAFPRAPIEVECMLDLRPKWTGTWHLRLHDLHGNEIVCQEEQPESLLPFNAWRRKVSFVTDLPAVGSASFEITIAEGTGAQAPAAPALQHSIDERTGLLYSLLADGGRECLAGSLLAPLVVEDDGDSWGSDRWSYRDVIGRFSPVGRPRILHAGPVRTIMESVFGYNHSTIVFQTISYAEWPVVEFRLRLLWNEIRKRLKLSIPTVFHTGEVLCEIPGGAIRRPGDGQEHVHGRWLMLHGEVGGRDTGLGVVSGGQHGFDFQEGEIRLSVLRSAAYCHEQGLPLGERPARKYMDLGVHEIRLLVTARDSDVVRASLAGYADWLLAPPVAYAHLPLGSMTPLPQDASAGQGSNGRVSLLSLSPSNVRMIACKRSADGRALVIRLQEAAGVGVTGTVVLWKPDVSATVSFRPFEIKTVRFEKDGRWREVRAVEED